MLQNKVLWPGKVGEESLVDGEAGDGINAKVSTGMKHLFVALCAVLVAACNPARQNDPSSSADPSGEVQESPDPVSEDPQEGDMAEIMDADGNVLCKVSSNSTCTAVDAGIFYSIFNIGEYEFTGKAVYRLQLMDQDKYLVNKTIDRQGYEPYFARTEVDGNIYTLNLIGNPMDYEQDDLMLYGFMPSSNTISKVLVSSTGFPYAAMTSMGGKLLIMNHEMSEPKCDKVYALEDGQIKEVLSFPSGRESDSLRSLFGTDDGFYLLRLHLTDSQSELFIDKYDTRFNKLSSKSLSDLMSRAAAGIGLTQEDTKSEQGMHVAGFRVVDDRYMFYENFSVLRVIIDLQEDKSLFAGNDLYQLSIGNGRPLFYKLQFSASDDTDIVGLKDGAIEHIPFTPLKPDWLLQGLSISPSGNCLYLISTPARTTGYLWTTAP